MKLNDYGVINGFGCMFILNNEKMERPSFKLYTVLQLLESRVQFQYGGFLQNPDERSELRQLPQFVIDAELPVLSVLTLFSLL